MAYLSAVLGTPLKGRMLERLLRRGPATHKELAEDIGASRQQVAAIVAELRLLGVLDEGPLAGDRRARLVSVNEDHPFLEALRALAIDGATHFATPETWQHLLARHYGEDWYLGGYAAIRRVMQPVDFEDDHVLVSLARPDGKLDVPAILERAAGVKLRIRVVDHVPPEVVPVTRDGDRIWFASPERGFVEAWKLQEIPLYGLFLCLAQGLHDAVLSPEKILAVAPSEQMEREVMTLLAAMRERLPLRELRTPLHATRALKPAEKDALGEAINTVVG